jgi:hypothetical protein
MIMKNPFDDATPARAPRRSPRTTLTGTTRH